MQWEVCMLCVSHHCFLLGHKTNTFRSNMQPVVLFFNNWSIWQFDSTVSLKPDVHSLYSNISYIYAQSSIHFKVRDWSLKLKYATLQHSIYASFMGHEASVVKYWWGVRCRDGIFLQCCHLQATETTTQHHDTETQKTKQDRAKTCTYHSIPHSMYLYYNLYVWLKQQTILRMKMTLENNWKYNQYKIKQMKTKLDKPLE